MSRAVTADGSRQEEACGRRRVVALFTELARNQDR